MEDLVKKMRKKAQDDIVSALVQKKKAKNGERVDTNTYAIAIQALSAIGKTVTKGTLYTAINREYTKRCMGIHLLLCQ